MENKVLSEKKQNHRQIYQQTALVFFAFFVTILASLFAIVNVMDKLLDLSTEKSLSQIETNIDNTLENIDMVFGSTYYYVKRRINEGADNEQILQTLVDVTSWIASSSAGKTFLNGVYGSVRGEYLDGSGWEPDSDYIPTERPWYIDAVKAGGIPVIADPYIDAMTEQLITGISQAIFDDNGVLVGVLSVDAYLDELFHYMKGLKFDDGGYVVLLDGNKNVLIHPDMEMLGKKYMDIRPNLVYIFDKLQQNDKTLIAEKFINDDGKKYMLSIKELKNGWFLMNTVLESSFYSVIYGVIIILSFIGFLGFIITAYILYRLNKQREFAVEANEGKTAFLARMSHELRTPLNAINGFAEIEFRKKHDKETQENILKIISSGNILAGIINDILDISRIESGKFEFMPYEYSFADLIKDVMNMNIIRIGDKKVVLKLKIEENVPDKLLGDEIRVKQIINNVLSNAIKYTFEGEVSVKFSAAAISDTVSKIIIEVKDTGVGISKDNIDKLFSEYSRIDADKHRQVEGTGLGLHITKKLVQKMDGDINVESEYGKGSIFTVSINQLLVDNSFISDETISKLEKLDFTKQNTGIIQPINFVSLPDINVLVVDDVQVNLDVAVGIMHPYGMKVDTLLSGEETFALIKSGCEKYDILFIDHMMPGMDGIECVKKIRQIGSEYTKTVPIIALTANAVVGMEQEFLDAGFSGFISKPISTVKLDKIIHKFIAKDFDRQKYLNVDTVETEKITELPKIDGLDLDEGVRKFSGNLEVYLRVLNSFISNIPQKLVEISHPEDMNLIDYTITVHGIKGSCYGINANVLGDKSAELEKLAKENNLDEIQKLNPQFLQSVEKLIADLKIFIESENSAKPEKEKKSRPDTDILLKLLTAAQNYDNDDMRNAIAELEKFDYEDGNDFVSQIKKNIDGFDYDAVIELIEKYLET